MELYIVRHGQSESNAGIDAEDPALTETGKEQARLTGETLQNVRFDRVYTSHLTRAVQTAAAILTAQQSEATLEILPELAECGSESHIAEETALRALYSRMGIRGLTARSFPDGAARAAWCLQACVYDNAYTGELPVTGETSEGEQRENPMNVLIVCHGTFNAHLIGQMIHFPFDKNVVISQRNACVNRFQLYTVGGVRRVRFRALNSTAHLPEHLLT